MNQRRNPHLDPRGTRADVMNLTYLAIALIPLDIQPPPGSTECPYFLVWRGCGFDPGGHTILRSYECYVTRPVRADARVREKRFTKKRLEGNGNPRSRFSRYTSRNPFRIVGESESTIEARISALREPLLKRQLPAPFSILSERVRVSLRGVANR